MMFTSEESSTRNQSTSKKSHLNKFNPVPQGGGAINEGGCMRRLALGLRKGKRMLRPLVRLRGGEWGRNTTAGVLEGFAPLPQYTRGK